MGARLLMSYPRIFQSNLMAMEQPRMGANAWVCRDEHHGSWWNRKWWSAVIIIDRDLPFAISSLTG